MDFFRSSQRRFGEVLTSVPEDLENFSLRAHFRGRTTPAPLVVSPAFNSLVGVSSESQMHQNLSFLCVFFRAYWGPSYAVLFPLTITVAPSHPRPWCVRKSRARPTHHLAATPGIVTRNTTACACFSCFQHCYFSHRTKFGVGEEYQKSSLKNTPRCANVSARCASERCLVVVHMGGQVTTVHVGEQVDTRHTLAHAHVTLS